MHLLDLLKLRRNTKKTDLAGDGFFGLTTSARNRITSLFVIVTTSLIM
jgi:hypothetical protein